MSPHPEDHADRALGGLAELVHADGTVQFERAVAACQRCLVEIAKQELHLNEDEACAHAQNAIVEVRELLPQFCGSSDAELRGWLRAILLNETYQQRQASPLLSTPDRGEASTPDQASLESTHGQGALTQKHALWQALEKLPRDQFKIIHRRHHLHSTLEEIAEVLGVKVNVARALYVRALACFTQEFTERTPDRGECRPIPPLWEEACRRVLAAGPAALKPDFADVEPELLPYFRNVIRCLEAVAAVWPYRPSQDEMPTTPEAPNNEMDRLPKVAGFVIDRKIGGGGQGVVYRAWQERLNCFVALKFLRPAYAQDPEGLRRFRQEAETAARLAEHGILQIRDMLEVDGTLALVLPYIEGCNLAHILDQRRKLAQGKTLEGAPHAWSALSEQKFIDRLLPFLDKVVDAMARLNQAGVLHRDLKPSNILVDKNENCWLIDFGLARPTDDASTSSDVRVAMGTPGFMSPEQWAGAADVDVRTDVFGLGATIYQSLCLDFPYGTACITSEVSQARVPPKKNRLLPRNLDLVLQKALQPNRLKRYQSTTELRADWQLARHGDLPTRIRVSRGRKAIHFLRRHHVKVAVIVAVLLTGVAASLGPAVFRGPTAEELEDAKQQEEMRRIKAELKAGKAVDLIGATGAPAYYRWVTPESSEQRTALKKDDGTFAVTAHDQALLELVPNPMSDQYRLQVEIKHDSSEGLHGQVGIYFAHTRFQPKKDRGHAFCGLYYNDLGDEVAQRPDGRAPGNALRLYRSALLESVMTGPNRMMTPHWHFAPVGPRGNFRWRKLRLELTGEALTIFWEGQQVLHLSRDQVLGCKVFPDPRFDAESLQCEPRGGLGLYLYRSTASFRNVRLEPILSR